MEQIGYYFPKQNVRDVSRQLRSHAGTTVGESRLPGDKGIMKFHDDRAAPDLEAYGLIELGKGGAQLSELGVRLLRATNEEEVHRALVQAVLHVPIYRELLPLTMKDPVEEHDIVMAVVGLSGMSADDAKAYVPRVRELIAELRDVGIPREIVDSYTMVEAEQSQAAAPRMQPGDKAAVIRFRAGTTLKEFPFTPEGVEAISRELRDDKFWNFLLSEAKQNQGGNQC